ncbi:MAG: condensation domain-containing protein, partial [Gammaproteobacteria bacterium]|nr:condensation domain-containing protein [Gammaproteobacteria bacterium]
AAPTTPLQSTLCEIWQSVLGLERVGIHDNFFSIGGDSILAISLITRQKEHKVFITIKDLFTHQSIYKISQLTNRHTDRDILEKNISPFSLITLDEKKYLKSKLKSSTIDDAYPLTRLQEGMLFHSIKDADKSVYHDVFSYDLHETLDYSKFCRELQNIVEANEILRTTFFLSGKQPLQIVHKYVNYNVNLTDLSNFPEDEQIKKIDAFLKLERLQAFDYDKPLWKIFLHRKGEQHFQYTLSFHHALMDGWSIANFNTQLFSRYKASLKNENVSSNPIPLPYRFYVTSEIDALNSPEAKNYWTEKFINTTVPWWTGFLKSESVSVNIEIPDHLSKKLFSLAKILSVQERTLLFAAHAGFIAFLNGSFNGVTSYVTNGRPELSGSEHTLGLFLNSLPLNFSLRDCSWRQFIETVNKTLLEDSEYREYPLSNIQQTTGIDFSSSLFNFTNFHIYEELSEKIEVTGSQAFEETNYAFVSDFTKNDFNQTIYLSVTMDAGIFKENLRKNIPQYYIALFEFLIQNLDNVIDIQSLLTGKGTTTSKTNNSVHVCNNLNSQCIHERFEAQVHAHPSAIALVYEDQSM